MPWLEPGALMLLYLFRPNGNILYPFALGSAGPVATVASRRRFAPTDCDSDSELLRLGVFYVAGSPIFGDRYRVVGLLSSY